MCRKKKIKCDGKMPACSHCLNYKIECIFTQVEKKRNPPKGYAPWFKVASRTLIEMQRKIHRGAGEPPWSDGVSTEAFWDIKRRE